MNPLEHRIINQVVALNALNRGVAHADRYKGSGFSGVALADRYKFSKGLGDCGCDVGFGAAPAGAPADYVCQGSRFRYVATVTSGITSGAPIISPNAAVQSNLLSQGVQVLSISDNAGVLSYVAGSFASWQITIDMIWPLDMSHRADVQSVTDAAVANAGLNVSQSSLAVISDACTAGPSTPTAVAPVTPGTTPAASGGIVNKIENALGITSASGAVGWVLIIGGGIAGLFLLKAVLGK